MNFLLSLLLSMATQSANAAVPVIKADGSSTVFPITEGVAEEFQKEKKGKVRVTVGISGTGGGFKKFCRGETDLQNASRPISASEIEVCRKAKIKYYEIPVAYDATVVVVNPNNKWLKEITVDELKKMWEPAAQGKIKTWNQINPKWPKEELKLFGAGADSGTFDYFTQAIVGKEKSSRGDYTASEDDNTLVMGVSTEKNALGYLPMAYYEENQSKLRAVPIVGGKDSPMKMKSVLPSKATVENGQYYPLSRPIFIYFSENSMVRPEVKEFAEFYIKNANTLVPQAKYVALPKEAYDGGLKHLTDKKLGTAFGGKSPIGLKIKQLLEMEKSL
ncbi:MAG: PstS family phosphate ABC transporter substrate-binding protein [Bdellovibrionales bacterium]|nr:PstS family phosphate ABC transporter substrate-binding protein [Bdellovibrionales bacterium]